MSKAEIQDDYYNWLINLTNGWCSDKRNYKKLMHKLFSKAFKSPIDNDKNRASDGIEMRMRFIEESGLDYTYRDVYLYLNSPCKMLEMMAALACRCEEHIMSDPELGDRTHIWFYDMLVSMHINNLTDNNYDDDAAEEAINRVIFRTYEPNGDGGLFTVDHPQYDMRYAEIWYQLNWYLAEFIR